MSKQRKNLSWTALAEQLNGGTARALKRDCEAIREKLDAMIGGRQNYRILTPAQQDLIKSHLGYNHE